MNINDLEKANKLAKDLIPKVDELLNMSSKSNSAILGESIYGLSNGDEDFRYKFNKLLSETKQRFQKEFDEI